jgi:hypothetical protein
MPPMYSGQERTLPSWAKEHGALFAWDGVVWKVVSHGSHNNTPERAHLCWCNIRATSEPWKCSCPPRLSMFVEYVQALPVAEEAARLPEAPTSVNDVASALSVIMCQGRRFYPDVLACVMRVVSNEVAT